MIAILIGLGLLLLLAAVLAWPVMLLWPLFIDTLGVEEHVTRLISLTDAIIILLMLGLLTGRWTMFSD